MNNNRIKSYTGKSNRCFPKEPGKYSTLINIHTRLSFICPPDGLEPQLLINELKLAAYDEEDLL